MRAPRTRPQGVTILAILAAVGGVLGLIAGIFALGLGGAIGASLLVKRSGQRRAGAAATERSG